MYKWYAVSIERVNSPPNIFTFTALVMATDTD